VGKLEPKMNSLQENVEHIKQHMVGKDEFMAALGLLKDVHDIVSRTVDHQLVTQSKIKKLESGR
jgi:hypothetical protein